MRAALLRVSVVGPDSRVDLAVPPTLPVAELVPGLARRLGIVSYAGLRLCTATGTPLEDAAGLSAQGVPDGAVLALAEPPPVPPLHDDPAEAVAGTARSDGFPRWTAAVAAALLLLLGACTAGAAGQARPAAVVGLLLLAGALVLGRSAPEQAVLAATAGSAYAAVAAGLLAADLRPGTGVVWAAPGGGALALASLTTAALPSHRLWMLPTLVVGTAAAVLGAGLSVRTVPLAVLACVLLVTTVVLGAALPWLAVGRISRPARRLDPDVVAAEARLARELIVGLAAGFGTVQVVITPVVARQGLAGVVLAGCASTLVLLRARHHAAAAEALPGMLAGGVGLLGTVGVALWLHRAWGPVGTLLLAGAGGVLLAQGRLRRPCLGGRDARVSDEVVRSGLRALETLLLAALLPLLVLATRGAVPG